MILKIRQSDGWFYLDDIERLSTNVAREEGDYDTRHWFKSFSEVGEWVKKAFGPSGVNQFDNEWWCVDFPKDAGDPNVVCPAQAVTVCTFTRRDRWEMCVVGSGTEAFLLNDQGKTIDRV